MRNSKGCILANYRYVPEMFYREEDAQNYTESVPIGMDQLYGADFDGALITTSVDSYHPNRFGIYNMSGNVSEMIQDYTAVKGGSWYSESYFLQITSNEKMSEVTPSEVGFRLVFEIQ